MRRRITAAATALLLLASPALAGELTAEGLGKLKRQLKQAMVEGDDEALASALVDLARDDSAQAVELILKSALAVPHGKVLTAATQGLSGVRSAEAVAALCAPLQKKGGNPAAKILCLDALAGHDDPASGEALAASLSDKRPEVLRAALAAVRKRREVRAVDPLIDLLELLGKRPDALMLDAVNNALLEITGKYFEQVEDWRKYWETVRGSFRPQTGSVAAGVRTGEREKKPTFFGTEIASERLVFVIDTSGSMEGDRLRKCKEQLAQCIDGLSPRSRFTIVAFSNQVRVWNKALQLASPRAKAQAKEFVEAIKASGNTFTLTALKEGLGVDGADAIVLLSDGMPTETDSKGEMLTPEYILEQVDAENRFKRWRIDTFGFEGATGGSLGQFMKDLAQAHGGTFTPID